MENAVKAFYMGAAMIIAVMVLGVWIYVFKNGARLGAQYEGSIHASQVLKFNSQFNRYVKTTNQTGSEYGYSFIEKGNTASDIITCANLAQSINKENDYDNRNNVTVIVNCKSYGPDDVRGYYYYIFPFKDQPKTSFIKSSSPMNINSAKSIAKFNDTNSMDFYKFLKAFSNVRIVDIDAGANYKSTGETIYEYYFDVDKDEEGHADQGITYFETTGKIDKIVFTVTKRTDNYDDGKDDAHPTKYWSNTR